MTLHSYFRAVVRAHREVRPEPECSRYGEMSRSDLKLYPVMQNVRKGTWWPTPPNRPKSLVRTAVVGPGRQMRSKKRREARMASQLTRKCQLGQNQQIQILGLGSAQNRVGSVQVVVNIADLRRELETPDPHRCSLGVCRGYGVAAAGASGQRQDCDRDASATKDPAQARGRRRLRMTSGLLSPGLSVADRVA